MDIQYIYMPNMMIFVVLGYDCGLYVIATAEHKCRELCEGFCVAIRDTITSATMKNKREQLIQLIHQVASEFAGS